MRYEIISRFFDKARGVYVDPGAVCPRLDRRTAERLVRARCIAPIEKDPAPKRPRGARGKSPAKPTPTDLAAPPAPPPDGE